VHLSLSTVTLKAMLLPPFECHYLPWGLSPPAGSRRRTLFTHTLCALIR